MCGSCGVGFGRLGVDEACVLVAAVPGRARAAALAVAGPSRRVRAVAGGWSIAEYVCHLRDVYVTYTIRLHRVRTEDAPVLEPMLNDLRARRFGYNDRDVVAVLDELTATAEGFLREVAHISPPQWERVATRLPGEQRTSRWMVRQAAHEGVHHVRDIEALAGSDHG